MSADNYYMIRKDRQGFFVPVMGFSSVEGNPHVQASSPRFNDFHAAIEYASNDYTEYGITVHEECYSEDAPVLSKRLVTGHYAACVTQDFQYETSECNCETIKKDWETDYSLYVK